MGDWTRKYTCGSCQDYSFEGEDKKGYCSRYRAYYYPDDSCKNWEDQDKGRVKRMGDWVRKYTCGSCKEYEFEGENQKGYCNRYKAYYYPDDSCNYWEESSSVSSSSGGCYLTTACTEYYGLPDNCPELTTLRNFRDSFMAKTAAGRCDICEYYATAPKIVDAINRSADKDSVYQGIYTRVILPCVELIQNEKLQDAYDRYKRMVLALQERFL